MLRFKAARDASVMGSPGATFSEAGGAGLLGTSLTDASRRRRGWATPTPSGEIRDLPLPVRRPEPARDVRHEARRPRRRSAGPFRPIASRTPGLLICEHLPRLARPLGQVLRRPDDDPPVQRPQRPATTSRPATLSHVPAGGGFDATQTTGRRWARSSSTSITSTTRRRIARTPCRATPCCPTRWDASRRPASTPPGRATPAGSGRTVQPLTTVDRQAGPPGQPLLPRLHATRS